MIFIFLFACFLCLCVANFDMEVMGIMTVDKAINNAVASLKMEGYDIDDESIQHCKEL